MKCNHFLCCLILTIVFLISTAALSDVMSLYLERKADNPLSETRYEFVFKSEKADVFDEMMLNSSTYLTSFPIIKNFRYEQGLELLLIPLNWLLLFLISAKSEEKISTAGIQSGIWSMVSCILKNWQHQRCISIIQLIELHFWEIDMTCAE